MIAFKQLFGLLKEAFTQQQCLLCCQTSQTLICRYCREDLNLFDLKSCDYNLLQRQNIHSHLQPPLYEKLVALAPYQWPVSSLISRLKFNDKLINAKALADLFRWHIFNELKGSLNPQDTLFIPVPLHFSRLRHRKYNQSIEIVRHFNLGKKPFDYQLCQRQKPTRAQTELSASQRRKNLKGAFTVSGEITANRIIIFDDVVTTGTTVNSLCEALLTKNPNLTIEVWCIALTLRS